MNHRHRNKALALQMLCWQYYSMNHAWIIKEMKKHHISKMPKLLGYLGLLPFIVPTVFLFFDDSHLDMWRHFLLSYGAVILSFVGALHWSFAMLLHELPINKQRWSFFWSVIPSLVAWMSLSIPKFYGFILLTAFFAIALIRDKQLSDKVELPAWYTPLRRNLTIVAMTCLLIATYLGNGRQLMNLI